MASTSRIPQVPQAGHQCRRRGDRGQAPLGIAAVLLEMAPHQVLQHGAILRRQGTAVDQDLEPVGRVLSRDQRWKASSRLACSIRPTWSARMPKSRSVSMSALAIEEAPAMMERRTEALRPGRRDGGDNGMARLARAAH